MAIRWRSWPRRSTLGYFRGWLVDGLGYGDGAKSDRPPLDPVFMFRVLFLQTQHNLNDERMEYMIRDQLSWLGFLDLDLEKFLHNV